MRLAMIGLGRMGGNMTRRLMRAGHQVVVFDRSADAVKALGDEGAQGASSLEDACARLDPPRVVWLMVPAGDPVEQTMIALTPLLGRGDVIVDGGNSNFRDSMRRGTRLSEHGIALLDAGTSGGVWGLENGYCLMIGGAAEAFRVCEPLFAALAPANGYAHVGPSGAGHFVKMVHNGIEYGLLQAYAEGYEILHAAPEFGLDLARISALWNQGSVVRSWLNELAALAFAGDPELAGLRGFVDDSGEGRWTVLEAIDRNVPAPVTALSLMMRFRSRQSDSFAARVVAALRREFGGHATRQ